MEGLRRLKALLAAPEIYELSSDSDDDAAPPAKRPRLAAPVASSSQSGKGKAREIIDVDDDDAPPTSLSQRITCPLCMTEIASNKVRSRSAPRR